MRFFYVAHDPERENKLCADILLKSLVIGTHIYDNHGMV